MTGTGGEPTPPLERLTVILAVLAQGEGRPVPVDDILAKVSYGADNVQDRRDQLRRDVRNLEALGWVIPNVAAPGEGAQYRLVAVDNRLMLELTPEQRFELMRAALLTGDVDVGGLGGVDAPPPLVSESFHGADAEVSGVLEEARWAAARRCLVRFRYKGRGRVAHPQAVHLRPGGWYLTAREVGDDAVKTFAVDRIDELRLDPPGSAEPPPQDPVRPQLDPISWRVDPPVDAVVETTPDHRPRVERLLGAATSSVDGPAQGTLRLTIPVTARQAFRSRLYQLGTRARLVGPPSLCDEVRADLLSAVAAGDRP